MPRCFLAKKSSSSTSLTSSCIISSEIEEANNHLDDHLTPLTEKWDDTITVKSEIETEDEEGISSDGNCSNNSGDDHFIPPSRLIHRSTVGSISAAQAVQSIKEPLAVVTPCIDSAIKSPSIYHQNYDSNNEKFIPSHIKNDDAQSTVPELPDKEKSISPLTSSISIATQTYSHPEDDSEEEDVKSSASILDRKPKSITIDDFSELANGRLSKSTTEVETSTSSKCDDSNPSKDDDSTTNSNKSVHCMNSKDFNGNDDKSKASYLEQKEKLEKNLLNQTLKFCTRKHSKKHQKRKKKLLTSKVDFSPKINAKDGTNISNTEGNTLCLGKSFQQPIKLNKSFATLTVVHPMQQSLSNSQQHAPLKVRPFQVTAVSTVSNSNFKLLPQQPVSIAAPASVFPISTPSSTAITGLSFPATAVTAGGATIHPISTTPSNDRNEASKLSSTLNNHNIDATGKTSCPPQGKFKNTLNLYCLFVQV